MGSFIAATFKDSQLGRPVSQGHAKTLDVRMPGTEQRFRSCDLGAAAVHFTLPLRFALR
jgi:hypothetical protein